MNTLIRLIERATGRVGILAALLIVPLILATCYEVFARYLFDAPTIWAYEIGYTLTGAHFLLAMAYALQENQHIRIDIFSGHFSPRTRAAIDLVCYAVLLPLTVWLTFALVRYFWSGYVANERSGASALNMPVWPFRIVFFVAFALLALQILAEIIKIGWTLWHDRTWPPAPARVGGDGVGAGTARSGSTSSTGRETR